MVIGWYRGDVFSAGERAAKRIATVDGRHARLFKYAGRVGAGAPTQYDMVRQDSGDGREGGEAGTEGREGGDGSPPV